jgi:YHS domain-containing protein
MLKKKLVVPGLIAMVALSASFVVAANGLTLEGVKCLMVASKDAKEEKAAEWKEGKVFFCCDNCKGKFDKMTKADKEKMAAKSNAQLVATKQYEQKACPFSGGDLNADTKIKVGGAEVAFCCNNCKGKAEKMKEDEQLEGVFGEKAFKTAKFELVKKEK